MTKPKRQVERTHRYTLRVKESVFDKMVALAEQEKRSIAKEMEMALELYIERKTKTA